MPISLDLYGEVTTAAGTTYKWDANQPPASRPQNLSFRTKIGEGFSDASLQLARRIDQDYEDLNLVDTVTFTGADGTVAYEGRNSAMPRDLGDHHSVGVTLAGWMAHAADRKFQEIYVDRVTGRWGEMPLARKEELATGAKSFGDFSVSADGDALTFDLPNSALGAQTVGYAFYRMPPGMLAKTVQYQVATTSLPAGWTVSLAGSDMEALTSGEGFALTTGDVLTSQSFSNAREFVWLEIYSNGNARTPAAGASVRFRRLAVTGNHGIILHTGEPGEPDGVYASDVMIDIASRFCPQLDTSGVQPTGYVIQHCAFPTPTTPFDAFLELNKYHLWKLAVWENKRLEFGPYDLSNYDWEIRTDDPGTTFSPQGESTESLCNGIDVTYTNALSGVLDRVTPEDSADLADSSSENPWNRHGVDHWDDITLSTPASAATAQQLGAAALGDRNRPRTPGTISVRGYIRDRAGNLQPCWKVRAGDTISISNFPNDSPRLIVETDYDDEAKLVRLSIDKPFALLDAYLDRQTNALQAKGLA